MHYLCCALLHVATCELMFLCAKQHSWMQLRAQQLRQGCYGHMCVSNHEVLIITFVLGCKSTHLTSAGTSGRFCGW